MKMNNSYDNVRSEEDMERSKAYDLAIKESLKDKGYKFEENDDNSVYLNNEYRAALLNKLKEKGLEVTYSGEINHAYGKDKESKYKMCSIASSSRLCFLYFLDKNVKYEYIIQDDKICKPHLDAYDEDQTIFYECKCHEFLNKYNHFLSKRYQTLLHKYFQKEFKVKDKKIELKYEDFFKDFAKCGTLFDCGKFFDFKQFICHIIGLLSLKNPKNKPTLQYVFFKPDFNKIGKIPNSIREWRENFENHVEELFDKLRNIEVRKDNEIKPLPDFINLPDPLSVCVSDIEDII